MAKRARSAKSGKYVSKAYAKKYKETTVVEKSKREKVLRRGYVVDPPFSKPVNAFDHVIATDMALALNRLSSAKRFGVKNPKIKKVKVVEED